VQNRVGLGFGLVLAALLANAAVAGWNVYRIRQNDRAVAKSYAVLDALDRLLLTMQDAETGQRGYLLTGRPAYLQPYHDAVRDVRDRLAAVRALLPADEGQERARALEADVNAKLEELETTVALHDKEGRTRP
jgi:CHASE3 domain sensor protein